MTVRTNAQATKPVRTKKRADKYWLCSDCAKAKGWKEPKWPVTVIRGLCGHCTRKDVAFLTPEVDFLKPGQKYRYWD